MAKVNYGEELDWELDVDFPSWANTEIYVKTISKGYLLEGEKPKDAYWRVATRVAQRLNKPQMATKFFDYIWKGWLNLATPVLSNTGTDRGLPISCFGIDVADSIYDIGSKNLELMSKSIMTTDTHPKVVSKVITIDDKEITITGVAKGAGMIEPNMATMLAFILTDAVIQPSNLQSCLTGAVNHSFNRITIDGDQSTNDTVLMLANGNANNSDILPHSPAWSIFTDAVNKVCFELAMMIVHDGEGADRFITLVVEEALSDADADIAARSVANSLLNKTAWAGSYPDWGRIMDAIGYSSAKISSEKVNIFYGDTQAVEAGCQYDVDHKTLVEAVSEKELFIRVQLGLGDGKATVYTCNCTERYVRINY